MKDLIRYISTIGGAFVIGFFLLAGFITYQSQLNLEQSRELVSQTSAHLMQLRLILSTLKDCETGQRGFVITGDDSYLEPYDKCHSVVDSLIDRLQVLIDGDLEDHQKVETIRQLANEKLAELHQTIELRRKSGFPAAQQVVITNSGKKIMDQMREIIAGIEHKQQAILDRRLAVLSHQFAMSRIYSIALITLGCLFLAGMLISISRLVSAREKEMARLTAILDTAAEGIISISEQGIIESANRAAYKIFRYQQGDLLGKAAKIIFPEFSEIIREKAGNDSSAEIADIEVIGLRSDGSQIPIEIAYTTIVVGNGKVTTGIIRDISERKEIERRVSEFYSTVSHELRTPLTSIRGSLSLMDGGRAGELSPRAQLLVKVARSESERLIRLINDILDIKKIESGKLDLTLDSYDVAEMVNEAMDGLQGVAEQSEVEMSTQIEAPDKLYCDKDCIKQVLANLISNAIKFSSTGGKVSIIVQKSNAGNYKFSICDHGPGIHADDMSKLFGLFQQLDPSDSRRKGGTGLGLAISKALVDKHDGQIGVESEVGKGSVFWFELPNAPMLHSQARGAYKSTTLVKTKSNVLIVEDDENLSRLLAMMLEDQDFIPTQAGSIREAETYLQNNGNPDVIILDLSLPDGDGLVLMDKLRHDNKTAEIPVVIVSGREPEIGNYSHPLLIDWIKKPFDETRLLSALSLAVKKRRSGRARVLLVEDDQATREVIKQNLEALNVEFIEAEDGVTAVHYARLKNPDLIVLDLSIPSLDGFEVVQLLRKEHVQIPLIVYTARDLTDNDKRELTLGLTSHLIKSRTSEEQLLETVRKMLDGLLEKTEAPV